MTTIEMPKTCGVILLPGVTLFPHGGMPIRFVEPSHRRMFHEAMKGQCMVVVGNRVGDVSEDWADSVAPIGTLAMIRAARVMEDGSIQALLHGIIRVRLKGWLRDKAYPVAELEMVMSVFQPQEQASAAVKVMMGVVEDLVRGYEGEYRDQLLEVLQRADDPTLMSDIISQQFVEDGEVRRELLEMESVAERISLICRHLQGLDGLGGGK